MLCSACRAFRGPPFHRVPPCLPVEGDPPRASDRRRAPTLLEPHPRRAPARGPGLHLAPVARTPPRPPVRGRHAARRSARAAPPLGGAALRAPVGSLHGGRARPWNACRSRGI